MVVDSIKKLISYFSNKVLGKSDDDDSIESISTTTTTTMSTAIASNDGEEEQSLYTIFENGLKDNVSIVCYLRFQNRMF